MTESEAVILHKEINKLHDKIDTLTGTVQEQAGTIQTQAKEMTSMKGTIQEQAGTIQTQAKRIDELTKLVAFYESANMPTSKPSLYNQERKKFRERRGENPVGSPELMIKVNNCELILPLKSIRLSVDTAMDKDDADMVLDPFMGSSSTAIATEQNGRKWVGIDISKEYCTKAMTRIKTARKHERSQDITAWR